MEDDNTITISTAFDDLYTVDTVDISSITTSTIDTTGFSDYSIDWDTIEITDSENRTSLRDSGTIPLDIWAKMYNNNKLEDDLF